MSAVAREPLELLGLTDDAGEPKSATQYAIVTPDGKRHLYGDQKWVAYGNAIRDGSHPDGRIQQRSITIAYGPWEDVAGGES